VLAALDELNTRVLDSLDPGQKAEINSLFMDAKAAIGDVYGPVVNPEEPPPAPEPLPPVEPPAEG
jgi:hypothetical protein